MTTSSIQKTIKHTSKDVNVGAMEEAPDKSSKSYAIHDSCRTCSLAIYIRIVCHDDLEALVMSGTPPKEELESARFAIINEFAEKSGNSYTRKAYSALQDYYMYRSQLVGLTVCTNLIQVDEVNLALLFLKQTGVRIRFSSEEKYKLLSLVKGHIKEREIRMEEARKRHAALSSSQKGEEATEEGFYDQVAMIEKHRGHSIDMDIPLSKYAAYLKQFNKDIEHGQRKINPR